MIMQTSNVAERPTVSEIEVRRHTVSDSQPGIELGLLTACRDRHYAFGLAMALVAEGVSMDFVGGDEIDSPELHTTSNLRFLNFRGDQRVRPATQEDYRSCLSTMGSSSGMRHAPNPGSAHPMER